MDSTTPLLFTSCQSPNAETGCRDITAYIAAHLGRSCRFVADMPWQERAQQIEQGGFDVAWICGLPYVKLINHAQPTVRLLAAPIMQGKRYQNQPVYFSDVIVTRRSRFRQFTDLGGMVWAYNEPGSHSGFGVVAYHLAMLGKGWEFFGRVIESGAHEISLQMILDGEIDASAIDSTVLETELLTRPEIADKIRVIDTLGPSPIPPWVVSSTMEEAVYWQLRRLFVTMHESDAGRAVLAQSHIDRFVAVNDADYDRIREMAAIAAGRNEDGR